MVTTSYPLTATTLSHYVRLERCERYLRLSLCRDDLATLLAGFADLDVRQQPLSPLLQAYGGSFEEQVVAGLPAGLLDLQASTDASATVAALTRLSPGDSCMLVQAPLDGVIGRWSCVGRADIIHAMRRDDGSFTVLIADIKASHRERVAYRLQVAFYVRLLVAMLGGAQLRVQTWAGAILTLGAEGGLPQFDDPASRFDLAPYDLVLGTLLEGETCEVARVVDAPFESVSYSLGYKCDSCTFNEVCMADSARRKDVALVPFIRPAEVRALRTSGVCTLEQVRDLPVVALAAGSPACSDSTLRGRPVAATLARMPALAAQRDRLQQRARAMLRGSDAGSPVALLLHDGAVSQLPAEESNPDLVKVFLDAQADYLQGHIYLMGALVQGPRGRRSTVRIAVGPPDDNGEETLLIDLVRDLWEAIPEVARDRAAVPVHIYVYDGHHQRILLEALSRHLETVCGVPGLFDVLTATPALEQPMLAVLHDELRDRYALGMTCQNLYSVASVLGFQWRTEHDDFRSLFFRGVFDGRRRGADGVWVESASRLSSQIPLEYAYAAWNTLPRDRTHPGHAAAYQRCTVEVLRRFQDHRLDALAHIEAAVRGKNRGLVKEPLALPAASTTAQPDGGLARALKEFLAIEHHTALQQRLALYLRPIAERAGLGRALLLRCAEVGGTAKEPVVRFAVEWAAVGLEPEAGLAALRLREDDWTVLNQADGRLGWPIEHGRLAVIARLEGETIELKLLSLTSYRSSFKYSHDTALVPEVGQQYTLDEMPDDLNFDKYQEAIRHAEENALYRHLAAGRIPPCSARPPTGRDRQFLERIRIVEFPHHLTGAQEDVISAYLQAPVLCVQGPPGTGKTATLGWAVLARLFARDERPLRVAVCAKTHKATALVLASIAEKLRVFGSTREGRAMRQVHLYKVANTGADELPRGVQALDPYRDFATASAAFTDPLAVIGGTPSGLYALVKARSRAGMDWTNKPFDLVVIDEASQMSLPEAVLAGAFLKPDGALLVVGDHRQMPPIVAHRWERDRRRTTAAHRPDRSVFETLRDQGCPSVGLDESFRLHHVHAAFLAKHIYRRDGIALHSRRKELLAPLSGQSDPYVTAALCPYYPVVVIEHDEAASGQSNLLEMALVAPLVEACLRDLGLDAVDGLGVVVPHRAQKALLSLMFPTLAAEDAVDTVERFQGGERDVIIVSATASDPEYVMAEAGFLLNLNRFNVAISRPRRKLIVVASRTVLDLVTDDIALFEHALLWKHLRHDQTTLLWNGEREGHTVRLYGRHCGHELSPPPPAEVPLELSLPTRTARSARKERW